MTEETREIKLGSHVWMVIPRSSLKPAEEMENIEGSVMSDRSLSFSAFLTKQRLFTVAVILEGCRKCGKAEALNFPEIRSFFPFV